MSIQWDDAIGAIAASNAVPVDTVTHGPQPCEGCRRIAAGALRALDEAGFAVMRRADVERLEQAAASSDRWRERFRAAVRELFPPRQGSAQPSISSVHVVAIEEHVVDRGLWCQACAKSTAKRIIVTTVADPTTPLRDVTWCQECDARWTSGGAS